MATLGDRDDVTIEEMTWESMELVCPFAYVFAGPRTERVRLACNCSVTDTDSWLTQKLTEIGVCECEYKVHVYSFESSLHYNNRLPGAKLF